MSIEQQLAENTAALRSLEAAIRAIVMANTAAPAAAEPAELTAEPVKAAKEAKAKKPATPVETQTAAPQESAASTPPTPEESQTNTANEAPAGEVKALDYEADIKPLVLQVVKSGKRGEVVELLESYGVANASALPADQWAAFRNKLTKLLEN